MSFKVCFVVLQMVKFGSRKWRVVISFLDGRIHDFPGEFTKRQIQRGFVLVFFILDLVLIGSSGEFNAMRAPVFCVTQS